MRLMITHLKRKKMNKNEIKLWIARWSKLKPSSQRDMVIKIWSELITNKSE